MSEDNDEVKTKEEAAQKISDIMKQCSSLLFLAESIAEDWGLEFTFVAPGGKRSKYVSLDASGWQPSDHCEWEESAAYGYDYGWID